MASEIRSNLKYTKEHEWAKVEGNKVRIGLTDYAQSELTDIVYVELPQTNKKVNKGDAIAVVESVKSTSDIYAPISGTIIEVNKKLENSPEIINQHPYDDGWIAVIEISNPNELTNLLSAEEYSKMVKK